MSATDVRNVVVWQEASGEWCVTWDERHRGALLPRQALRVPAHVARRLAEDADAAALFVAGVGAQRRNERPA